MAWEKKIETNGSGIAELGGEPAIAGVKPPNEAEKAAYLSNTALAAVRAIAKSAFELPEPLERHQ